MRMSRKLFVCLALSLFALVIPGSAEAQRFRWWQDEAIVRDLGLSPDQTARIDGVFKAALPALRAQQRALSKLEDELSKLVQDARVDEPEFQHFAQKVEAARADLAVTRTLMIYRMRRIMTLEQHLKLQAVFEQREKDRHSKGRGRK